MSYFEKFNRWMKRTPPETDDDSEIDVTTLSDTHRKYLNPKTGEVRTGEKLERIKKNEW